VKTPREAFFFHFYLVFWLNFCIFVPENQFIMSYISLIPREQLMLPSSIDEYVSSENIVRFIDAFVDKVIKANFALIKKGKSREGKPAYPPACLAKLFLYGYLNSISSSRKLERETQKDLEVIWLMQNLTPDHWTISNFRKENSALIKRIAIDFRKFLKDNGYIKCKSISTDGTKIKANASRDVLTMGLIDKKLANAEKEIERYLKQLESNDADENQQETLLKDTENLQKKMDFLQEEVKKLTEQKNLLEKLGVTSLSPTDPEAKLMKTKDGYLPSYNVQTTADNDSHYITSCETTDYPNDYYSLKENYDEVEEQLSYSPEEVLADGGYANEDDVQALENQDVNVFTTFPQEPESKKVQRDNGITFSYDEKQDCFKCSQGKSLLLVEKNCQKKSRTYNKYQCKECSQCPVKQYCTTSKTGRTIYLRLDGEWLNNYKIQMETPAFKKAFSRRKCVIEHPYATMKYYMGQIPILLRGKAKVQIEMDLYSTAYNLTHAKNTITVPVLLEKLKNWTPTPAFSAFFSAFSAIFHSKKVSARLFETTPAFPAKMAA
jgi:transposase